MPLSQTREDLNEGLARNFDRNAQIHPLCMRTIANGSNGPLDALPLWGVFVAILIVVLLSVECGYRLGRYRRNRHEQEKETPVGTMVGATLGLLAFILAFTFGLAAARFDTRRQVLLDEANAIGTTYLRAGMLPEQRNEIRTLLRNYVKFA
jgi:hypothetical protein